MTDYFFKNTYFELRYSVEMPNPLLRINLKFFLETKLYYIY